MKVGDRVLYVGTKRPDWHGIPATITSYSPVAVRVEFDREWTNSFWGSPMTGRMGSGIPPRDLRPLMVIDPDKPLVADGNLAKGRPFEVIGTINLKEHGRELLIVKPTEGFGANLYVDPATGRVVPKTAGERTGAALQFRNAPAVRTYGTSTEDGRISLNITETDGEITNVEWVK